MTITSWARARSAKSRTERSLLRLSVLGGEEQRGERLERGHELVELARLEAFVGLRREVVGERLDPLLDRATLFAEPTVIADQAAIAHSFDDGGELRGREVVDASELLRGHAHVEGQQDVSLDAADTLDHQGGDVSVAAVLARKGTG